MQNLHWKMTTKTVVNKKSMIFNCTLTNLSVSDIHFSAIMILFTMKINEYDSPQIC